MNPTPHTILMGDPCFFSIKGGANPHTRGLLGLRKTVNRELAIQQWRYLKDFLEERGVRIWTVPAVPEWPGMVYPANAGFMKNRDDPNRPLAEKPFYLSNMIETRRGETEHFRRLLEEKKIRCLSVTKRFEGEADLIAARNLYIYTSGRLERQRFRPALAIPPWKRVYGFRSDPSLIDEIKSDWGLGKVVPVSLVDEAHYHGDTVICSFGIDREFLLVHRAGISAGSWTRLSDEFEDRMIVLEEADARIYAANSFQTIVNDRPVLVMPRGITSNLAARIREWGTEVETVDVSEFWKKGGGSVKCMIGDLGRWGE